MIPLDWLRSLKQANGQPFLADSLARYGYLPNPLDANGLPVGFTAPGPAGTQTVGMTCSACHTRQIVVDGKAYRIDGGPGIVDFESLLRDLDTAVGAVLTSDASFAPFAAAVLGSPTPDPKDVAALRVNVAAWFLRYHAIVSRALPQSPTPLWGPARLDAVSMIFNRVTGLDLGSPPSLLITDNIMAADAPVRYPFLWNAPVQDLTQWPGFADNGNDTLALGRNLGEVFGVFGVFQPKREGFVINFLNNNSANFNGLDALENLIKQIGPPKWPWPIDTALADQGQAIYQRHTDQGGCADCHGITPGQVRFLLKQTWATPIQNANTDTHQFDILTRKAKTGVLQGAFIPGSPPLQPTDTAFNVLTTSVVGSIIEHILNIGGENATAAVRLPGAAAKSTFAPAQLSGELPPALKELQSAFHPPAPAGATTLAQPQTQGQAANGKAPPPRKGFYEARVLQGIWATAPYLHNGSVPTLAELLKPPADRVKSFKVGPAYDTTNVGLATEQTQFSYQLQTTDCSNLNSGNSNCGHSFGTQLMPDEKKALLEYLKRL
jgi:hypothetical protein